MTDHVCLHGLCASSCMSCAFDDGAADFEALRAELARVTEERDRARAEERERCARICDRADKSTHPAELADMIRDDVEAKT